MTTVRGGILSVKNKAAVVTATVAMIATISVHRMGLGRA
jgi:hypothetical protein